MKFAFRDRWLSVAACMVAVAAILGIGDWTRPVLAQQHALTSDELDIVQLRPDFYMIAGAGGNIAVQIGPIGVVLVDSGSTQMADRVLAAIKTLTSRPIRYIISTSADPDHVGGNEKLSKAGVTILGGTRGNASFEDIANAVDLNGGLASVLAHEEVLTRMSGPAAQPYIMWPSKTYTGRGYSMSLNGEGIQVLHQPAAHSDGDSVVLFRRADVVVTGDIVDVNRFPVIDPAIGGSIQGEIDALNRLVELVIPPFPLAWQEGRTYVIPGHGRALDFADVEEYRDMVVIVTDVIADMIGRGMSLAQVKAANPTKAYRNRYGADSGPWTTDMFVESVFKSLTAKKQDLMTKK